MSLTFGGTTIKLADLARVAARQRKVQLDVTMRDRIQKSTETLAIRAVEVPDEAAGGDGELLEERLARVYVALQLTQLVHGRVGARVEILELLVTLLNENVLPRITAASSEVAAGEALARLLVGKGTTLAGAPVADALRGCEAQAVELSERDVAVLRAGHVLALAYAAAATFEASMLVDVADVTVSLTLEGASAFREPFETTHHDVTHPQRGNVRVADNVRSMLHGSTLVDSRKSVKQQDALSLQAYAQYQGAVRAAVETLDVTMQVEVNSSAAHAPSTASNKTAGMLPSSVASGVATLAHAMGTMARGSERRVVQLVEGGARYNNGALLVHPEAPEGATGMQGAIALVEAAVARAEAAARTTVGALQLEKASAGGDGGDARTDVLVRVGAAARAALAVVRAAKDALVVEECVAMQALAIKEHAIVQKQREKEARAAEREAAMAAEAAAKAAAAAAEGVDAAAAAAAGDAGKKMNARAAKKKQKKEKKKKDKGAKVKKLGVGAGSALWREYIKPGVPAVKDDGELAGVVAGAGRALDVWDEAMRDKLVQVFMCNKVRQKPKIPKGTRDYKPEQMVIRERAFNIVTGVFKRHGAVTIDTPVFERRDTLMNKYGEDSKLIYDLQDQGGELLSLRYDLTVPFARYVAMHGIQNIKRYHISRVYRRDQPQMNRGRYREFYQCDFDVAGDYGRMIPDAEVVSVMCEILAALPIGTFVVKLNHRRLLDAYMEIAGVPADKFRPICSAIDKLDKEPWEAVKVEMVDEKGLPEDVADRIGEFVKYVGEPRMLLTQLQALDAFKTHEAARQALNDVALLFDYLESFGVLEHISFDLSLARGLDYYTGVIYEAVIKDGNVRVGSIAAGGRYDTLVGMFSSSGKAIPAVGVSIGIERVFTLMEEAERRKGAPVRRNSTQVLVASIDKGMLKERMRLCAQLWAGGVKAEFLPMENPKLRKQLDYANENHIPLCIVFGRQETEKGVLQLKDMDAAEDSDVKQVEVAADGIVAAIQEALARK